MRKVETSAEIVKNVAGIHAHIRDALERVGASQCLGNPIQTAGRRGVSFSALLDAARLAFPNKLPEAIFVDSEREVGSLIDDVGGPDDEFEGEQVVGNLEVVTGQSPAAEGRADAAAVCAKSPNTVPAAKAPEGEVRKGDCTIIGELTDALLDQEVVIAHGMSREDRYFQNRPLTVRKLIKSLDKFNYGNKDGLCILQGAVGDSRERKSKNMLANYIVMIDVDNGTPIVEIVDKVRAHELFAVAWTTHSHMTTVTPIDEGALVRWLRRNKEDLAQESTDVWQQAQRYLLEEKRYDPRVLQDCTFKRGHVDGSAKIVVTHNPMPKCRVMFVLNQPWNFLEDGPQIDRIDGWKKAYDAAANAIGLPYDKSCTDPARLMYTPRKRSREAPGEIVVIAGKTLDLKSFVAEATIADRFEKGLKSTATVSKGRELQTPGLLRFIAKHPNFDIVSWLREREPDDARGSGNTDEKTNWACPNEDSHSEIKSDDTAFFAAFSSDGWTAGCLHNTCKTQSDNDRAWFLDRLCLKYNATTEDLMPYSGKAREEQAERDAEAKARDSLPKLIEALTPEADPAAVRDVLQTIVVAGVDSLDVDHYVKSIVARTEHKKTVLDAALRDLQRNKQRETKAQGSEEHGSELAGRIADFNERFAVIQVGSIVSVAQLNKPVVTFLQVHAFKTLTAPERVVVGERSVAVADRWLKDPSRTTYEGVHFKPRGINDMIEPGQTGTLNLWKGWSVERKKGDWSKLKRHIFEVLCRRNPYYFAYFMSWLADMIQNPADKPGVAIVIKGKKGTGKSTVGDWIARMMPRNSCTISKGDQVTGRFNGHLQGMLFTLIEEALWAGDKGGEGVLKDLLTNPKQRIEEKFKDSFETENHNHVMLCSNNDWVVPATGDERRFFVVEASDKHMQDVAYFKPLYDQMEAGGLEAMMYDLSVLKQPAWIELRNAPVTPWLGDQVEEGLDPFDRWWLSVLRSGELTDASGKPTELDTIGPLRMRVDEAYEAYVASCRLIKVYKTLHITEFGKKMSDLGATKRKLKVEDLSGYDTATTGAKRVRVYEFTDDLAGLRAKFERAQKIQIKPDVVIDEDKPAEDGQGDGVEEDYSVMVPDDVPAEEIACWRQYGMGERDLP